MRAVLVKLAEEIIQGGQNGLTANDKFQQLVNEHANLKESLLALTSSDNYIFVYCSNMIKLIQSGEFCIISQTRSEENVINLVQSNNKKSKTYGTIISSIAYLVITKERVSYITKSMQDLISLCLKVLFQDNNNIPYLQSLINNFIPSYKIDQNIVFSNDSVVAPFTIRNDFDSNNIGNYCLLVKIFTSTFEYIVQFLGNKSYYEYRRNIYIFRNSYLAIFLQFGIENLKFFFSNLNNNSFEHLRPLIALTLQLLEQVFMYPFTMSLHQFQIEDEIGENITCLGSGDIYFPNSFRHVICDEQFLNSLLQYYQMVLNITQNFEYSRTELYSLIRIIGRASTPSQYSFKSNEQRAISRLFSIKVIEQLASSCKFMQSYYLNNLLDIVHKILTISDIVVNEYKLIVLSKAIQFLKMVISKSYIKIQDGKRNPVSKAFEILSVCLDNFKERLDQAELAKFKEECQLIFELFLSRILSSEADHIINEFGVNKPSQIQCFSEMFQFVIPIFQSSLSKNLSNFEEIDINKLSSGSKIIWLHLCSQLLPKNQSTERQARIILKYYDLAKEGNTLASLRYIRTLTEEILQEISDGVSTTILWNNLRAISQVGFLQYIDRVLSICMHNFQQKNSQIIDYSLEFFKIIYASLRKHDHKVFQNYYQKVKDLLKRLNETIFAMPEFYHKRRAFFNVISVIWINTDKLQYIYELYRLVSEKIRSVDYSPPAFYQFLHDITGLIEPIDRHEAFEVIVEIVIQDLQFYFDKYLTVDKFYQFFGDYYSMKIFCKLALSLITDINRKLYFQTHTDIPLKIHDLLYPYISKFAEGNFEMTNKMCIIFEKMVYLNPLSKLIDLRNVITQVKTNCPDHYDKLVKTYFQNIQRIQDVYWMYNHIQQNIDHMTLWWQECMIRELKPEINIKTISQARIWTNVRQKQSLARLIFEIGLYNSSYWDIKSIQTQRDFISHFNVLYPS